MLLDNTPDQSTDDCDVKKFQILIEQKFSNQKLRYDRNHRSGPHSELQTSNGCPDCVKEEHCRKITRNPGSEKVKDN